MKVDFIRLFKSFLQGVALPVVMIGVGVGVSLQAQVVPQSLPNPNNEPRAVFPVPTERQMLWQEVEFYAFFHYGMNTFTGKEWGFGDEAETIFAPTVLPDCRQWVQTAKKAGMKGGLAIVKHHDGFCLWPTESTTHNVMRSAKLGPQVNIPRDFAEASKAEGMKYGFYISPWDRNSALYGTDRYVMDVFLKQVSEVSKFGNGDQFEIWFDGANGGDGYYGGQRGTRQINEKIYYDMPNLVDSIHKLQPNCVVWGDKGWSEARWIGNEQGWAGVTNWALADRDDLTRSALTNGQENGWAWIPGEADAKATDSGWFWHRGEAPYSLDKLYKMYLETVGRNATFILNLPPNQQGVLPLATVTRMEELGSLLKSRLGNDLAKQARVTASEERTSGQNRTYVASHLTDNNKDTYWATNDITINGASVTLTWDTPVNAHYVMLQEFIRKGQRVKKFTIETSVDGSTWTKRADSITTTIGYKRIVPLNGSTDIYGPGYNVKAIRITLNDSKACPLLHTISVY